jgi:hypothetical protein
MTTIAAVPPVADARAWRVAVDRLLPFLAGTVVFAVAALVIDGLPVGVVRDDAMYVVLAKSLATGHGYRWLHLPGLPPATHFPPGYPALLAVLWWLFPSFPSNLIVFKLANALFSAVAAVGVSRFGRLRLGMTEWGAQGFGLAALLGAPTLALGALVMSEPLFLAMLLPALILAERIVDEPPARTPEVVTLGLLAGAVTLVRTHGIALVAAGIVMLCMRRRFRHAAFFGIAALVLLLPWELWVAAHAGGLPATMSGNYESYAGWLVAGVRSEGVALLAQTALRTSRELALMFQFLVAPALPAAVGIAALLVLAALSAVGARVVWRRAPVSAAFLAIHTAIVVLWPFTPARFVWGVWPLVLLLPVAGVRELLRWRPSAPQWRATRVAVLAAAAMLACGYATYNARGYQSQSLPTRRFANGIRPLLTWVAEHTRRDALLASESEGAVYLYTGRPTVPLGTFTVTDYLKPRTLSGNAAVVRAIIGRYRPEAVVVSTGFLRAAVRELALSQPPLLTVVDTFPGGIVLTPTSR